MAAVSGDEVRRRLQVELADREGNMRRLAREIAANTDTPIERVRRTLYRLITDGAVPNESTSRLLEQGLERPAGYFTVVRQAGRTPDRLAEIAAHLEEVAAALIRLEEGQSRILDRIQQSAAQDQARTAQAPPKRRR